MKVLLAKTSGFCWGVKRALDLVNETLDSKSDDIYTYGPLIHNQNVVQMLSQKGVSHVDSYKDVSKGTVIVRTHGLPFNIVEKLKEKGVNVVDATCPHVLRSQLAVKKASENGSTIVIVGDKKHAEVVSLQGSCSSDSTIYVVESSDEADKYEMKQPICVIAQSTFNEKEFYRTYEKLKDKYEFVNKIDSICLSVTNRQKEIQNLALEVDSIVVIGGYNSANTSQLAKIARSTGRPTFHIERVDDLDHEKIRQYKTVAVTAGASTPEWIITPVIKFLEKL